MIIQGTRVTNATIQAYPGYVYHYRYWKFSVSEVANPLIEDRKIWQIAELKLKFFDQYLSYEGASAYSTLGVVYSGGESPSAAIDGNPATKFCSQASSGGTNGMSGLGWPLIIDMGRTVAASAFTYVTANDANLIRDPVRWVLWGSNDSDNWDPVHWTTGFSPPYARETETEVFQFNAPLNAHLTVYPATGGITGDYEYTAWVSPPTNNGADVIPVGALALGTNYNNRIGGIYTVTNNVEDGGYQKVTVNGNVESVIYGVTNVGSNEQFETYWSGLLTSNLVLHLNPGISGSWDGTTLYDQSPSGVNATSVNSVTRSNSNGGFLHFSSGDSQYLTGSEVPNMNTNEWTIEAFVRINALPGGIAVPAILTQQYVSGAYLEYSLCIDNVGLDPGSNGLFAGAYSSSQWHGVWTPATTGAWQHIVGTYNYNNQTRSIYINGVRMAHFTTTIPAIQSNGLGYFVGRRWDYTEYMDMDLGALRMYNRALTDQEVLINFNYERRRFGL